MHVRHGLRLPRFLSGDHVGTEQQSKITVSADPSGCEDINFGVICLLLQGYLFEHVYDRQVLLSLFIVSGCMWLTLTSYVPLQWWPSPVFAWSYTIGVLSLVIWSIAPNAFITLTLKTWFFKMIQFRIDIPTVIFPLAYFICLFWLTARLGSYQDLFSLKTMAMIPTEAAAFFIILLAVPRRDVEKLSPDLLVNREIARAESYYTRENREAGRTRLKRLFEGPLNQETAGRIAELAWRFNDDEIARDAYIALMREVSKTQDFHKIVTTVEDILEKGVQLPFSTIHSAVQVCLKRNLFTEVRRILPHMAGHKEVGDESIADIWEEMGKRMIAQPFPKKDILVECLSFLEVNRPESETLIKIQNWFRKMSSKESHNILTDFSMEISKFLDIQILNVTSQHLHIKIIDGKEQKVPWSVLEGVFGCHVVTESERGFLGCVMLKFKRKIYACNFKREGIIMKDRGGRDLGFETLWDLFKQHVPIGIPFLQIDAFQQLNDLSEYEKIVQNFFKR